MKIKNFKIMICALTGLFLIDSCYSKRNVLDIGKIELTRIQNVRDFYEQDIEWVLQKHSEREMAGEPSVIWREGIVNIYISQKDSLYIVTRIIHNSKVHREQYYAAMESDTILPTCEDIKTVYEFSRDVTPLNELFKYITQEPLYYDYVPIEKSFTPLFSRFALLDSTGEIKLMWNMNTEIYTKYYYNTSVNF